MTENSEARKRHEERDAQDYDICHSTEHACGWHFTDTITITISREDAEHWAQHHPRAIGQYEQRIANAVRAKLKEKQYE